MEEETNGSLNHDEKLTKEVPQLVAVLKEMKDGLDTVTSKVQDLTAKVKAGLFPTADGISYLEAKHLLLLNYCQLLVYYLLRKAKGFSIENHPVVRSLVEIRLYLEKIRSIDKKMQYQIQKLTRVNETPVETGKVNDKEPTDERTEDLLKYRPNPDMLDPKSNITSEDGPGVYRPPKIAPATMDEDKMSKLEKSAKRKEANELRRARQNPYMRGLIDDVEGRPEEVRDTIDFENREVSRYISKLDEKARHEEDNFIRAPVTKAERKKAKQMERSRNGLLGLTDGFSDEIRALGMEDGDDQTTSFGNSNSRGRKFKKRKMKY